MTRYTTDAVALLCYLVDALPARADRLFAEAEAGETVLEVPSTTLAEVLYSVSRDTDVRGVTLRGTPEETRQALVENGPITLVPADEATMVEYAETVGTFSIHDALIVASHRARSTDAVITTDGVVRDSNVETVWG